MFNKIFRKKRNIFGAQIADWLIVTIGLAVFAAITLWTITKSSVWFDEAFGAYMIHFNFFEIARYTATDVHPPLFYWLLKLWAMLFGNTELALRSMSVLFGGIAIIFGYLLSNKLFGKKAARISLIFMVLSPMFIRYSQEMRMYTLVTAIALAATYTLTFAINTKKRLPWVLYGILVALGMWTHYFVAVVWIAHWIWRADIIRRVAKKSEFMKKFFSKDWVMAHIVAVAIFIPWLPLLARQIFDVQINGFWISPVTPDTIPNFMTNFLYYQDVGNVSGWLALGFLVIVVSLAVLALRVYKSQNDSQRQAYRLIIALAFVPMLLLFVFSMPPPRSVFVDRYLIASTVGIAIFIGVTLSLGTKFIGRKWRTVATAFVVGLMIVGVVNVWQMGNYNKTLHTSNNTRQIIEAIDDQSKDNQPIIADSPWLFYEAVFYSTNNHPVYFINAKTVYRYGSLDMLKYNDQHKIMDIDKFSQDNPIVWYVGRPGNGAFNASYPNWKPLQQVSINDSISGNPAYKAIQYQVIQ